jgi:hypothetical protein
MWPFPTRLIVIASPKVVAIQGAAGPMPAIVDRCVASLLTMAFIANG